MMMFHFRRTIVNEFQPDYVSPPGDSILELLEAVGMTLESLAQSMGMSEDAVEEIIQGNAIITPEIALQLESVFGVPAAFWLRREQHYREGLARIKKGT
jgi:addiction module HigA family antidote